MSPALAAVALAVGAGTVAAISVRDLRVGLIGLTVTLVGGSLLVDPLPAPATLGVRVIGALLAVAILRATLPDAEAARAGSHFGWPAEALIAAAAGVGGIGIAFALQGTGGPSGLTSSVLITATAAAVLALGAGPAFLASSGPRRAVGLVLIAQAAILLRAGLVGTPGDLEQLAVVGLLLGCAAAGAALARDVERATEPADDAA